MMRDDGPVVVVVMGVSGVGKTTVGRTLAAETGWPFYDADDFHAPAMVAKMRRGEPLNDGDRQPWLARLGTFIAETLAAGDSAVLACSALRAAYRDALRRGDDRVRFVYLQAAPEVVRRRLLARRGHYMNPTLLESQYAALEEPADAFVVDARQTPEAIAAAVLSTLPARPPTEGGA